MKRDTRTFYWLAASWVPALAAPDLPGVIAARRALIDSGDPYAVTGSAFELYVLSPLVVLSACCLFLSPGIVASVALRRSRDAGRWAARAFALSIVILAIIAPLVDRIAEGPVTGRDFGVLVAMVTVVLALVARGRGGVERGDEERSGWATFLAPGLVFTAALAVGLAPKFFWEDLSGDGAHALETSRLLLHQPAPFWSPQAGPHSSFPGLKTFLFAYPASWFVRLFGDVDAAARFPLLLCLAPLCGAILGLAEHGRARLGIGARAMLWGALAAYAVVNAFSATYSPYVSDIAMPTASDTVCMAMLFGFLGSFFRGSRTGIVAFGILALCAGPAATLVMVFTVVAALLFMRPRPIAAVAFAAGVLVFATFALPPIMDSLSALGIHGPGQEHSAGKIAGRFRYLQFGHWIRFAWLALPCGVMPVVSMMRWRTQDGIARTITAVTIVYFTMFFMLAYVSLHYFVPTMLLPLVVHWRADVTAARRLPWMAATIVGLGVAMWSAIPDDPRCSTVVREVAGTLAVDVEGYDRCGDDVYRAADLLYRVYPAIGAYEVPNDAFGVSSLTLLRYAATTDRPSRPALILAPADVDGPPGAREAARGGGAALWILDEGVVKANIARRPPTPAGTRIYAVETAMLFVTRDIAGAKVLDLKPHVPQRLRGLLGW